VWLLSPPPHTTAVHWLEDLSPKTAALPGIKDALITVTALRDIELPCDQPVIEACAVSVDCQQSTDTNFADRSVKIIIK
jgi:hypothetical protein